MKKLIIFAMLTLGSIQIHAQLYRLDSLTQREAQLIRNAVISLTADSTFWQNDSLIAIVRSIDSQTSQGKSIYTATLTRKALLKVIENTIGTLYSDLNTIIQERNRARSELQAIQTKINVIKCIRKFETNRNIPRQRSIFEQLNTGFLNRNNFSHLN